MSVTIAAATPALRNRCAASATVSWLVSTHPLTASIAVANIDRTENFPGKLLASVADEFWIQERGRTNRDAVGAARERRADRLDCAQSAAHVDGAFHRCSNPRDRLDISRRAGDRAIEVYDVDKFRAGLLETARGLAGIRAVDGGSVHVAVEQAHDLAVLQVNGGNDGEFLEQANYSNRRFSC